MICKNEKYDDFFVLLLTGRLSIVYTESVIDKRRIERSLRDETESDGMAGGGFSVDKATSSKLLSKRLHLEPVQRSLYVQVGVECSAGRRSDVPALHCRFSLRIS